jgi:hypothetical protein
LVKKTFSTPAEGPMEVGGMDFFVASELSNSILNDIVAAYTRLEFKEGRNQSPDFKVIREYDLKRSEVFKELCRLDNFKSVDSMNKIIETYSPILKQLDNLE